MLIRFWGTRGSIPVALVGPRCVAKLSRRSCKPMADALMTMRLSSVSLMRNSIFLSGTATVATPRVWTSWWHRVHGV